MARTSPTQRTLKAMKDLGRDAGIVEKFQRFGGKFGVRQDLFGFIDIICMDKEQGIVAVQSTGQAFSEHIHKIMEECNELATKWVGHAKLELWGWRKVKVKRGGKAMTWTPRIADFYLVEGKLQYKERDRAN